MNLAHSEKQGDYFIMKYEALIPIVDNGYKLIHQYDKRTKKTYSYYKFQTKTSNFFTKWREIVYENNKKVITKKIANMLNEEGIAIKFFDDGYREKHCEAVDISMDNYDLQSTVNLKERIEELFQVKATVTTQMGIRIPSKYGRKFKDSIIKYASPSVLYKLI